MKSIINEKSRLYKLGDICMELFQLNMLFLLSCVPIVTIGGALIALSETTIKIHEDTLTKPTITYLRALKANFWSGLFYFISLNILVGLIVMEIRLMQFLPIISFIIVGSAVMFSVIVLLLLISYLFVYRAKYNNTILKSIKVCLQISLLNIKETLTLILSLCVLLAFSFDATGFTFLTFFFIFIGFSTINYFHTKLLLPIFKNYE